MVLRDELWHSSRMLVTVVKACWADPSAGSCTSIAALRICCPVRQGRSICGPSGDNQMRCAAMVRSMLLLHRMGPWKYNKLWLCLKCKFQDLCDKGREWMVTGCWSWVAAPVFSDSLHVAELLGWVHAVQTAFVSEGWRAKYWVELCELLPAWCDGVWQLTRRQEDGIGSGKRSPVTVIISRDTMVGRGGPWAESGWRLREYLKEGCHGVGYCSLH